jgi:hypothetical protein
MCNMQFQALDCTLIKILTCLDCSQGGLTILTT